MIHGSYNSFRNQVGYCKLQGYDTVSRSTSGAPPMFMDGRIAFGVGLSDVQFQGRTSSCGRCLNITHIENFFRFNDELTEWDYLTNITTPFTAFVMDQCKDAVCTSKYLDFDIYNIGQPVAHGNPWGLEWEFIPCPVNNDTMELLVCLGPSTCNVDDAETTSVASLRQQAVDASYWYCHVRNQRMPIVDVWVSFEEGGTNHRLQDDVGWRWSSKTPNTSTWTFTFQSEEGAVARFVLDWDTVVRTTTTPGYRGGIVIPMDIQV